VGLIYPTQTDQVEAGRAMHGLLFKTVDFVQT